MKAQKERRRNRKDIWEPLVCEMYEILRVEDRLFPTTILHNLSPPCSTWKIDSLEFYMHVTNKQTIIIIIIIIIIIKRERERE